MQTSNLAHRRHRRHRLGLVARAQAHGQLGMTLIEIMVVVAIISLVMGGVGIMAFNRYQDAQRQNTKTETITIQGAIEQYRTAKRGKCPKTMQDLKAAGFISKVAKDAWGNDFEFKCPGEKSSIDVISPGEDGEIGTADDITNYGEEGEGEEG
ncbi:type II secretion system protein GspG [Paraliomyxa miuraensis]|uniref:type II secretion system protein GspG n=1 Tax=Paraliomyxa miuraensis TaxID=376150 RepID=UPI002252A2E2|nr:type II secretion system protein GspG [Paraliomyxa miuraensis]MCX4242951.1 type II secretion system protein GspG [Paraliomyxa miuraensis]